MTDCKQRQKEGRKNDEIVACVAMFLESGTLEVLLERTPSISDAYRFLACKQEVYYAGYGASPATTHCQRNKLPVDSGGKQTHHIVRFSQTAPFVRILHAYSVFIIPPFHFCRQRNMLHLLPGPRLIGTHSLVSTSLPLFAYFAFVKQQD